MVAQGMCGEVDSGLGWKELLHRYDAALPASGRVGRPSHIVLRSVESPRRRVRKRPEWQDRRIIPEKEEIGRKYR